jgi:hypothetical protein
MRAPCAEEFVGVGVAAKFVAVGTPITGVGRLVSSPRAVVIQSFIEGF